MVAKRSSPPAARRRAAPGALRPWALVALVLAMAPAWPVAAQTGGSPPATPEERMVQTVLDQLAAFRRGDFAGAYAFASTAIRAHFDLVAFREMVLRGYAPIARSARSTVRQAELMAAGRGVVEVRIEGQNGETVDALYELVDEQGAWRIDGVLTRPVESGPTVGIPSPASALAAR